MESYTPRLQSSGLKNRQKDNDSMWEGDDKTAENSNDSDIEDEESSLTCCRLIVTELETVYKEREKSIRLNSNKLEYEIAQEIRMSRTSLIDQLRLAFHLALSAQKDIESAYFLSKIIELSCVGRSHAGVDVSSIVDGVIDGMGEGVKGRNEYVSYCCRTDSAHVLHHLLSTYTLEWSVKSDTKSVREYVQDLLFETASRGLSGVSLVLLYHLYSEGLIERDKGLPIPVLSVHDIPRRTYTVLNRLMNMLCQGEGGTKQS